LSAAGILFLGLILGLKHALEPDHIVAVSTIAAQQRSILRSLAIGAWWGVGHAVMLIGVGLTVVALGVKLPSQLTPAVEALVGVVLVVLGFDLIRRMRKEQLHAHAHEHEGDHHLHFHLHAADGQHRHSHRMRIGWRPMLTGMLHGMAGSAGLMLLVLSTVQGKQVALLFIGIFALGSIGAMAMTTLLLGSIFSMVSTRLEAFDRGLRFSLGIISASFGLWIAAGFARTLLR
jgi:ABC-type nickel/cobalt efflux system permease component RcnA